MDSLDKRRDCSGDDDERNQRRFVTAQKAGVRENHVGCACRGGDRQRKIGAAPPEERREFEAADDGNRENQDGEDRRGENRSNPKGGDESAVDDALSGELAEKPRGGGGFPGRCDARNLAPSHPGVRAGQQSLVVAIGGDDRQAVPARRNAHDLKRTAAGAKKWRAHDVEYDGNTLKTRQRFRKRSEKQRLVWGCVAGRAYTSSISFSLLPTRASISPIALSVSF